MKTRTRRAALGLAAALGISVFAGAASAEPTEKKKSEAANGYEYRFKDDLMNGDALGAAAPRIQVLKTGRRDRLLRPRLHFVPEMLKSVEKM